MAYRTRVELQLGGRGIRPMAAPVDTYVQPSLPQSAQLAQALGHIAPGLARFSENLVRRYNEAEMEKGRQAARKLAQEGKLAAAMTREGKLPMQENRFFMAGLQEEMGRLAAAQWQSDFVAKMGSDPEYAHLQTSTDIADFDRAVVKHTQEFLKDNPLVGNKFFDAGFNRIQAAYQQEQRLRFAYGIEDRLAKMSDDALFGRVIQTVEDDLRRGVSLDVTAKNIDALAQEFVNLGKPSERVQKTLIDALEAAARAQENPEDGRRLLQLFHKVTGVGGSSVRLTRYGAERLEKLENDLIDEQFQRERREQQRREQERKDRVDEAVLKYALLLQTDPQSRGREILEEYQDVAGDLLPLFSNLRNNATSLTFDDNMFVYRKVLARIFDPEERPITKAEIARMGGLSPSTQIRLMSLIDDAERDRSILERVEKLPTFKEELAAAEGYFKTAWNVVPSELMDRMMGLKAAFRHRVYELAKYEGFLEWDEAKQVRTLRALMVELSQMDPGVQPLRQKPVEGIPWSEREPELGKTPGGVHPRLREQQQQEQEQGQGQRPQQPQQTKPKDPFAQYGLVLPESVIEGALGGDRDAFMKVRQKAAELGIPPEQLKAFVLSQWAQVQARRK